MHAANNVFGFLHFHFHFVVMLNMFSKLIIKLELLSTNMVLNYSVKLFYILETLTLKMYTFNKVIDYI